ncbi:MAG: tetratricopeptide repeat protein, partial [Candidatus Aureabacteria bacterium]|nr:tetratricopeptide repeat protein [Candidatus Auribacterota bacterium]
SLLPMLPVAVALAGLISPALRRPAAGKAASVILLLWLGFLVGKTVTYASLWDDAVALTRQAYDLYPESEVIEDFLLGSYNNSTFDLIARGRFDEAAERYRRALAINPDFAVIRRNLGLVYLRQEKYSAAVEEFAASIRSRPQFIEAYHDLARAWKLLGKPAEALAVLAEGADKNPSAVSLRAALGFEYLEEGLPGAASGAFGTALSLDPSSAAAKRGLAAVQRMGERKK